jgi:hypothetical protein
VIDAVYEMKSLALTRQEVEDGWDWAEQWEHTAHAAPATAWGFAHGLTRFSQTRPYADATGWTAGKLLKWAASDSKAIVPVRS